jgi:hypothetical protein
VDVYVGVIRMFCELDQVGLLAVQDHVERS